MKIFLLLSSLLGSASAFAVPPKAHQSSATELGAMLRRDFFWTAAATAGFALVPPPAVAADVDYKAVAADISAMVKSDPDKGPTLVRLAWHVSEHCSSYPMRTHCLIHLSVIGYLR